MKGTIILGDTHGRRHWQDIVNTQSFDKLIFVGDYFDTKDDISANEQINNFLDILEFKRSGGKEVIMLIGNHDYHYLEIDNPYSGYQYTYSKAISNALVTNLDQLLMCYKEGDMLISHAGVTKTWMKSIGYSGEANYVDYINRLFKYKPYFFNFRGPEEHGDNITESPIWVRAKSLLKDSFYPKQIVGHTKMKKISPYKDYWFIDTLGTSGEYLKVFEGLRSTIVSIKEINKEKHGYKI